MAANAQADDAQEGMGAFLEKRAPDLVGLVARDLRLPSGW